MAISGNFLIPEEMLVELDPYNQDHFQVGGDEVRHAAVTFGGRRVRAYPKDLGVLLKYIKLPEFKLHLHPKHRGRRTGTLKEEVVSSTMDARKEIMQWLIQGLLS